MGHPNGSNGSPVNFGDPAGTGNGAPRKVGTTRRASGSPPTFDDAPQASAEPAQQAPAPDESGVAPGGPAPETNSGAGDKSAGPGQPGAAPPNGSVLRARPPDTMPVADEEPEPETPVFDWLTEVAIPITIFGLLGAFLYYMIDLRQAIGGQFSSGLRWVCFWFLLAAILITRMRTKYGDQTIALPYVLGLALATTLFVFHFTMSAGALAEGMTASGWLVSLGFNLALVGLTWWAADKVTRECTVEENIEHSLSQGFLADLSQAPTTSGKKAQPSHPGRVILWVSMVAVLAFGAGTRSIGDRSLSATHAFWCMSGFVFFALLLLALTNLSAIRMDVRQRKVRMSWGLVPTWIAMSMVLVLLIVAISALLPRPELQSGRAFSMGERAAWLRNPGRGLDGHLPASGIAQPPSDYTRAPGREPETNGSGLPTQNGQQQHSGQSGADQGQGQQGERAQTDGASGSGGAGQTGEDASGAGQGQGEGGQGGAGQAGSSETQAQAQSGGSGGRPPWWLWLLLLLLLAIVIYLLVRYRRQVMAFLRTVAEPFRAIWLAFLAFLERLRRMLGLGRRGLDEFADLPEDPFADIWEQRELGANMSPAQIVRHVYRAFMAFCALRGFGRADHLTEFEFLRTVPPRIGFEQDDQRLLTNMYVSATYSPAQVGAPMVDEARDVWTRLRPAIDRALAAQPQQRGGT